MSTSSPKPIDPDQTFIGSVLDAIVERWKPALDMLGRDWPYDGLDPHRCEFNRQGSCTYPGCYAVDE